MILTPYHRFNYVYVPYTIVQCSSFWDLVFPHVNYTEDARKMMGQRGGNDMKTWPKTESWMPTRAFTIPCELNQSELSCVSHDFRYITTPDSLLSIFIFLFRSCHFFWWDISHLFSSDQQFSLRCFILQQEKFVKFYLKFLQKMVEICNL